MQQSQVLQEFVTTKLGRNKLGKPGVGLVQPSARCDTVSDICELVGPVDLDEVLEDGSLDQVRVQLSYAVDLVRTDQSKVGHADHLGLRLFDDGDTSKQIAVAGKVALNELEEVQVYVIDYLTQR